MQMLSTSELGPKNGSLSPADVFARVSSQTVTAIQSCSLFRPMYQIIDGIGVTSVTESQHGIRRTKRYLHSLKAEMRRAMYVKAS
jgi:hypothetical protein